MNKPSPFEKGSIRKLDAQAALDAFLRRYRGQRILLEAVELKMIPSVTSNVPVSLRTKRSGQQCERLNQRVGISFPYATHTYFLGTFFY